MNRGLTTIIEKKADGYVALYPEVDVASQADPIEEARGNLKEALHRFFETASPEEVSEKRHSEVYVTNADVAVCDTSF